MNYDPDRFSHIRSLQSAVGVVALLGGFLLAGLGVLGYGDSVRVWMVASGLFVLLVAIAFMTFSPILLKLESTLARQLAELKTVADRLATQLIKLDAIEENTRISDAAKSVTHRDQEIEALRNAIREDILRGRWEAGLNLIDEMEQRFGFKEEAERIREELDDARRDAIEAKLAVAVKQIEEHFLSHQWERAEAEIIRLKHVLPNDAKVLSLQERMKVLQEEHKRRLREEWEEAVRRSDTDHAIDVLKELDQYLSATEAKELQDQARHVFKEKLLQLGIQFRFAVTEKRWKDALATGMELISEFPNARMTAEVRDAMDTLRERARATTETSHAAGSSR